MRMYHPNLEYTKVEGHPTTEKAFMAAWEPKGWLVWPPEPAEADSSFMDDEGDVDEDS